MRILWRALAALVRGSSPQDAAIDRLIKPVAFRPGFDRYSEELQQAAVRRRQRADAARKDVHAIEHRDDRRRARLEVAS